MRVLHSSFGLLTNSRFISNIFCMHNHCHFHSREVYCFAAMTKTVDEILEQIGQMGRFQISRLAIFCFLMFPPTFHVLNMYFLAAAAPWQCVKNSTECKLNGSFVVGDKNYDFRCTINRSEWEYADYEGPKDSIISQVNTMPSP